MAELRHYRYFVEIARRGSFTAASASLHVGQSALSEQIAQLERELGCKLFDRGRHGARLTPDGERLLDEAERLLRVAAEIELRARSLRRARGEVLRIGATMGPLLFWLPGALVALYSGHAELEVSIEDIPTAEIYLRVGTGQLDLGIVSLGSGSVSGTAGTGMEAVTLAEDDWVVLVPADHPFAGEQAVPLSALRDERLVLFPRNFSLRTVLDEFFARAGIAVQAAIEIGWVEIGIRFVEAGLGVSVVPRAVTLLPLGEVRVVELADERKPRRVLTALYRGDTPRAAIIQELIELARGQLEPLAERFGLQQGLSDPPWPVAGGPRPSRPPPSPPADGPGRAPGR